MIPFSFKFTASEPHRGHSGSHRLRLQLYLDHADIKQEIPAYVTRLIPHARIGSIAMSNAHANQHLGSLDAGCQGIEHRDAELG